MAPLYPIDVRTCNEHEINDNMDVLKPELIWVDGRCYRFFESGAWTNKSTMDSYVEDAYQPDYTDEESDDCISSNIEIVPYYSSKFKHSFHVAKPFFPFIIGSKHAVRKRIETETGTSIHIPKQDGDIVIVATDRRRIVHARRRIDSIVQVSRKKIYHTHFISVPFNHDEIVANFKSFQKDVIKKYGGYDGIDEQLFKKSHKLHFTIVMLTLLDDVERKQAIQLFMDCKQRIIDPFMKKHGPINIKLKGVECMNDDPSAVKVLYAPVLTKDDALQTLSNEILHFFKETEFATEERNTVKIHVTLMNTSNRQQLNEADHDYQKTFNARKLLKEYEDWFFGTAVLKEIHLSQISFATSNEYYPATAKITLDL